MEYRLKEILENSENIKKILNRALSLQMPNWYLGAGCIAQTVWNSLHNFDSDTGINDFDLVYYDAEDISYESEDIYIRKSKELFKDISIPVEIRNQARVHLWYEKHFGLPIKQYKSVEEAIASWPTTSTTIGVKYNNNGEFVVCAPNGLNDLFEMIVRPNKVQITKEIYEGKVERWVKIWPKLKIISWEKEEI
ncbi:MAG: hypothetical protein UU71_C0013G0035 [Parcubacteria group bacterium GW2011_GWB1_41_6]|nr:MAG: hypothetical protein UU71_C0013G0035 [Parcubacteria group bacterium GW2011_GWB1_41_6]KKS34657.1 MAG: hypothetical protein UU96_C0001G0012 [Parcubacteria group bacterium GW2011_GWC2_42_13]KKS58014.1 MAG: hypothetical protein UV22_C0008G0030 [Parcubacteria group bacterium GW2011_GWA2_42_35]